MSFLGLFKLTFDKTIVIFKISGREIIKMHEFVQNEKKKIESSVKNVFFEIYVFLFSKTTVTFEISAPKLLKIQSCLQK